MQSDFCVLETDKNKKNEDPSLNSSKIINYL